MFWNSIKLWHAIYSQQNRTNVTVCQLRHTYKIDYCKLSKLVKPQKCPWVSGRELERAAVENLYLSLWASSTLPLANAGVPPSLLRTLHGTWTYYTAWMTSSEYQKAEGCRSFIETGPTSLCREKCSEWPMQTYLQDIAQNTPSTPCNLSIQLSRRSCRSYHCKNLHSNSFPKLSRRMIRNILTCKTLKIITPPYRYHRFLEREIPCMPQTMNVSTSSCHLHFNSAICILLTGSWSCTLWSKDLGTFGSSFSLPFLLDLSETCNTNLPSFPSNGSWLPSFSGSNIISPL